MLLITYDYDVLTEIEIYKKYHDGKKPTSLLELAQWCAVEEYKTREEAWKILFKQCSYPRAISPVFCQPGWLCNRNRIIPENEKREICCASGIRNYKEYKGYSRNAEGKALYLLDKWTNRTKQSERSNAIEPKRIKQAKIEAEKFKINTVIEKMRKYTLTSLPDKPQSLEDPDYLIEIDNRAIVLRTEEVKVWDPEYHFPMLKNIIRTAYLLREDWYKLDDETLLKNFNEDENINNYNIEKISEKKITYTIHKNWIKRIVLELLYNE